MIKTIWNNYINWLLTYLDTDKGVNQFKMTFAHLLFISFIFFVCFIIFYFIIGTDNIILIVVVSIGYGRMIFDQILKKYDKNHPYDKQYTPFLRFIAYTMIILVTLMGTFMLIKDANENNTNV